MGIYKLLKKISSKKPHEKDLWYEKETLLLLIE